MAEPPLEDTAEDLYEDAPCGYLATRPDGTITRVNRTFLTWTGYRRDDLVGVRRFTDLLSPGGRIYHETHYAPLLRMQGEVREIAVDIVRADRGRLPVLVNATLRTDAAGQPRATRITVFNASDRRRYELELLAAIRRAEQSEARVRILQRLTAELAGAATVAEITAVAVRLTGDAVGASALIWMLDDERAELVGSELTDAQPRTVPRAARSPIAHALAGRDLVVLESIPAAEVAYPAFADLMRANDWPAVVAVPLVADDELGVVLCVCPAARTVTDEERALLLALGRQTGQALQRAQLFDAERRLRHRAEVLQRITAVLSTNPAAGDVAVAVVTELVEAGLADLAMVALTDADADADRLIPTARRGTGADDPRTWAALGLPDNWADDAGICYSTASSTGGGVVTLPLAVDGWSLGVLVLGYHRGRRHSAGHRAFLSTFATHSARAFERAHLQRETYRRAHRDAFLARLAGALDEVSTLRDRAGRLVDLLVPDLAVDAAVDLAEPAGMRRIAAIAADDRDRARLERAAATAIAVGKVQWADGPDRHIVALPLRARGNTLGAVTLRAATGHPFRDADLPFLEDIGYRAGLALDNARLYEHEHETAHILQQALLSSDPPTDERVRIAARYLPGTEDLEVGGDWHDTFLTGTGKIGLVVGDVVGRGINAATAMGQLRSATRALAGVQLGPVGVLEHLDRFVERLAAARVATLVYAEIDLDSGQMRFACAGHLPPLLVPPDGEPAHLWEGRSMPLGVVSARNPRTEAEVTLHPGSRLLLYTDGLVETRTVPLYDRMARLADTLARQRDVPPGTAVRALTDQMLDGGAMVDDVCLLCVDYRPA